MLTSFIEHNKRKSSKYLNHNTKSLKTDISPFKEHCQRVLGLALNPKLLHNSYQLSCQYEVLSRITSNIVHTIDEGFYIRREAEHLYKVNWNFTVSSNLDWLNALERIFHQLEHASAHKYFCLEFNLDDNFKIENDWARLALFKTIFDEKIVSLGLLRKPILGTIYHG